MRTITSQKVLAFMLASTFYVVQALADPAEDLIPAARRIDWQRNAGLHFAIPNYTDVSCSPSDSSG